MKKKSQSTAKQAEINDNLSNAVYLEPVEKKELMYQVPWSQERETEKAILFDPAPNNIESKPFWISKSQIRYVNGKAFIPMWLAKKVTR